MQAVVNVLPIERRNSRSRLRVYDWYMHGCWSMYNVVASCEWKPTQPHDHPCVRRFSMEWVRVMTSDADQVGRSTKLPAITEKCPST